MNFLIGLVIDCVLNCANPQGLPPVVQYHYGTFEQLFGQHTLGIGEM